MNLEREFQGVRFKENNTFLEVVDEDLAFRRRRNSAPDLIWRYDFSLPCETMGHTASMASTGSNETEGSSAGSSAGSDIEDLVLIDICNVMIKNIPCSCKKNEFMQVLEEKGFMKLCNFFYLPTRSGKILGYAFIGFPYPLLAEAFAKCFHGYKVPRRKSKKVLSIVPASVQGLQSHRHFRNNGVLNTQSLFSRRSESATDNASESRGQE
jgi:RNA recognition motif-containing protein